MSIALLALICALFAGLRTVGDADLGWQMATGRWIVQHHSIPSTDVLSYTARGREWIYPALSQVLLYWSFLLGGYTLLSWLGAAACIGTVAIQLRRGGVFTAVLALLAVPLIANRTPPRAEMFTEVLFAAFVSILWHYHRSASGPLWLLPVLMALWANLHEGFIAGLGMCAVYVFLELEDILLGRNQLAARQRLRRSAPWLAATVAVTILNPWGLGIYTSLPGQDEISRVCGRSIAEWEPVRLNLAAVAHALAGDSSTGTILWMSAACAVATIFALCRRRFVPAALLGSALYLVLHANRLQGPFASVTVIIGGGILADAACETGWIQRVYRRISPSIALVVLVGAVCLAGLRVWNLVTNRHYLRQPVTVSYFGTGSSGWYPMQAAAFVLREHLPANIFNDYNTGGYLSWALSPTYADFIDGRAVPFGPRMFFQSLELRGVSLDSVKWQQAADKYNVNTVILSLEHEIGGGLAGFGEACQSQRWRPVYIDSHSAVFVRVRPDTADLINRVHLDCSTVRFDSPPSRAGIGAGAERFGYYLNSGAILVALNRTQEALATLDRAEGIYSKNPYLHYAKGAALQKLGRPAQAEQELLTSIGLGSEDAVIALAGEYQRQGRYAEEVKILSRAAELSPSPFRFYLKLGYARLAQGSPKQALVSFNEAEKASPFLNVPGEFSAGVRAEIEEGRAAARRQMQSN